MTLQEQDLHTALLSLRKRLPKLRMRSHIRPYLLNAVHLYHKQQDRLIPRCVCQFMQMFCSAFSRCIRKIPGSAALKRASLDFHQKAFFSAFHHKVEA